MIVFVRISRTGSTSLVSLLGRVYGDRIASAQALHRNPELVSRVEAASGFMSFPLWQVMLDAIPDVKYITLLRDPVDRVVSHWRFLCRKANKVVYKDPVEFLEALPAACNVQTRIIGGVDNLKRFFFVGFTETWQASVKRLASLLDWPSVSGQDLYKMPTRMKVPVSDACLKKVRVMEDKDAALYARALGLHGEAVSK